MATSELDSLESGIRAAVEETKALRAEKLQLKSRLSEIAAERDSLREKVQPADNPNTPGLDHPQRDKICRRLQAILQRLERLEKRIDNSDR